MNDFQSKHTNKTALIWILLKKILHFETILSKCTPISMRTSNIYFVFNSFVKIVLFQNQHLKSTKKRFYYSANGVICHSKLTLHSIENKKILLFLFATAFRFVHQNKFKLFIFNKYLIVLSRIDLKIKLQSLFHPCMQKEIVISNFTVVLIKR